MLSQYNNVEMIFEIRYSNNHPQCQQYKSIIKYRPGMRSIHANRPDICFLGLRGMATPFSIFWTQVSEFLDARKKKRRRCTYLTRWHSTGLRNWRASGDLNSEDFINETWRRLRHMNQFFIENQLPYFEFLSTTLSHSFPKFREWWLHFDCLFSMFAGFVYFLRSQLNLCLFLAFALNDFTCNFFELKVFGLNFRIERLRI